MITFSWSDTAMHIHSQQREFRIKREQFDVIVEHLRSRLFRIKQDSGVAKSIRKDYLIGYRRDLKLTAHYACGVTSFEFYQEKNSDNRNGGRYCFNKFSRMPKRIQWFFRIEKTHLTKLALSMGLTDATKLHCPDILARDWVMLDIIGSWHFHGGDPFKDIWVSKEHYNCKDRDGKMIAPGSVKYFYDYDGNLKRGVVVKNLNNMWYVITGERSVSNVSAHDLFYYQGESRRSPKRAVERRKQLMKEAADRFGFEKASIFRDLLARDGKLK